MCRTISWPKAVIFYAESLETSPVQEIVRHRRPHKTVDCPFLLFGFCRDSSHLA